MSNVLLVKSVNCSQTEVPTEPLISYLQTLDMFRFACYIHHVLASMSGGVGDGDAIIDQQDGCQASDHSLRQSFNIC